MTTIRTITHAGKRFILLEDLVAAIGDRDMLAEAKVMLAVGIEKGDSHDDALARAFSSIVATGIGDVEPLNFKPFEQN